MARLDEERLEFTLSGTDSSVANAIRRVMMAEVPVMAIDTVTIEENSSVLHDEFIAQRLGLVPLRVVSSEPLTNMFSMAWECDCELDETGFCSKCSVRLTLDIANDSEDPEAEAVAVTSCDLNIDWPDHIALGRKCPIEVAHFSHKADETRARYDTGILLVKLGPGQRLAVSCIAKVGVGKIHAKYNPTATVAMRYQPEISLNLDLLEQLDEKEKREFVSSCTPGVFKFDKRSKQITIHNVNAANNIDEIRRVGMVIARRHKWSDNIVSVGFVPDRFHFVVEPSGSLHPATILDGALTALLAKMEELRVACTSATAAAAAGMGAGAVLSGATGAGAIGFGGVASIIPAGAGAAPVSGMAYK